MSMSVPVKFERYELFRILLPGFYAMSVIIVVLYSIYPIRMNIKSILDSNVSLYLFIMGGIFLGMLLYAHHHPKKIKFYTTKIIPELPHKYLRHILCNKCEEHCINYMKTDNDAVQVYFYLLYYFFDTKSQGVIHYFGSVYRFLATWFYLG